MLKLNSQVPDFTLPSTTGTNFTLSEDLQGQACIIYFYPKDFTPGCTKEACTFRDNHQVFNNLEVPVFGISRDSIATHLEFKKAHELPFELLSDVDGKVCKMYDALVPIIGVPKRITYLLNAEHKIIGTFNSMFDAAGHVRKMMTEIKGIKKNM